MGLFDKVKEKATDALEQGKEAAQAQQLKLQLRKLEGEVETTSAALGSAASRAILRQHLELWYALAAIAVVFTPAV